MAISLPPHCWRGREDCEPLHSVESFGPNELTEADFEKIYAGALKPESFVCGGCIPDDDRDDLPQDAYRVCWKNQFVDEIGNYDEQDLTHTLMVISQVLGVVATRRVNSGTIDVPTMQKKEKDGDLD